MADALVLSGAAVRGAFAAGALSVLFAPDVASRLGLGVTRIVGASSGALNGTFMAAAIRAGTTADAGQRLSTIWLDDATVTGAFDVSLRDVVRELGVSSDDKVLAVLRKNIAPSAGTAPVELRLVVTNADGEPIPVGGSDATTFEHVFTFSGPDFDTADALERVFVAAAASSALPGLFAPVAVTVNGRTVRGLDGGLVDDTPLGTALDGAPEVDRVFVIAPYPRVRAVPASLSGLDLAAHVLDMLVDERLVRDLRRTDEVNRALARLVTAVPDESQRNAVLDALGWTGRRPVEVVEIRPDAELSGNAFAGFTSRGLREQYVEAGVAAATAALGQGAGRAT
jgi:predicted acylesterase/phospholipase RssA